MTMVSRIAAMALLLGAMGLGPSAAQSPAGPDPAPAGAGAAADVARSQAELRHAEQVAETQRRLTDQRLRQRDRKVDRSIRSICKGC